MTPLLEVTDVVKTFRVSAGVIGRRSVAAVAGVTFEIDAGQVFGLVGESGSGKTTLARCVLGLAPVDSGRVVFDGVDVTGLPGRRRSQFRRRVQPVFQDPYGSLDPRWPVGRSIREALDALRIGTARDRDRRVLDLLDRVGLAASYAQRLPRQLSGGQRQRVGIAAALASGPELIVADEPVSALDVSVQAQVLNLLADLQRDLGLAVLLVAHDLAVVEHLSQRVAVMYLGRLVEVGPVGAVFAAARHPYTQALIEAIPQPDPGRQLPGMSLPGEIPSPINPPAGCHFHPRCLLAVPICQAIRPPLVEVAPTHCAACLVNAPPPDLASQTPTP